MVATLVSMSGDGDTGKREPTQSIPARDGDLEVPVPSRKDFLSFVDRVAPGLRKRPAATDEPPERSQ